MSTVTNTVQVDLQNLIEQRKRLRDVHNLILCLYSGFCGFSVAYELQIRQEGAGGLFNWHSLLCNPVEGTWLRPLSITFTISKIIEMIDTAFIIWLGKHPPVFLHTYHHATTFWLFCLVMNLPGPEKLGMLLNGFVHFLMYSHYYKSWSKQYVPIITILQILQLTTVIYAWYASPSECASDDPPPAFVTAKNDHFLEFNTPYTMAPVYLALFVVLFVKRFIFKKGKGNGGGSNSNNNKKNS